MFEQYTSQPIHCFIGTMLARRLSGGGFCLICLAHVHNVDVDVQRIFNIWTSVNTKSGYASCPHIYTGLLQ